MGFLFFNCFYVVGLGVKLCIIFSHTIFCKGTQDTFSSTQRHTRDRSHQNNRWGRPSKHKQRTTLSTFQVHLSANRSPSHTNRLFRQPLSHTPRHTTTQHHFQTPSNKRFTPLIPTRCHRNNLRTRPTSSHHTSPQHRHRFTRHPLLNHRTNRQCNPRQRNPRLHKQHSSPTSRALPNQQFRFNTKPIKRNTQSRALLSNRRRQQRPSGLRAWRFRYRNSRQRLFSLQSTPHKLSSQRFMQQQHQYNTRNTSQPTNHQRPYTRESNSHNINYNTHQRLNRPFNTHVNRGHQLLKHIFQRRQGGLRATTTRKRRLPFPTSKHAYRAGLDRRCVGGLLFTTTTI